MIFHVTYDISLELYPRNQIATKFNSYRPTWSALQHNTSTIQSDQTLNMAHNDDGANNENMNI